MQFMEDATLKGLRRASNKSQHPSQLSQSGDESCWAILIPGLPKRNPGLELANAFSV